MSTIQDLSFPQQNQRIQAKSLKEKQSNHQFQYRGITLKQYFRICDQTRQSPNHIPQQNSDQQYSDKQAKTPVFNVHPQPNHCYNPRKKMKTEVPQLSTQKSQKKYMMHNQISYQGQNSFKNKHSCPNNQIGQPHAVKQSSQHFHFQNIFPGNPQSNLRNNLLNRQTGKKGYPQKVYKQQLASIKDKQKRKEDQNRSTLTSFYQNQKKKKMMSKIKQDKQKANQLQQICKKIQYGRKMIINVNTMKSWQFSKEKWQQFQFYQFIV